MSGCVSFFFIIVIFLMVTSGMGLRMPFGSDRARPWRQLARDFNALFTGIGWFTAPALRFQHGSHRITVKSVAKRITFSATWPVRDLNCIVTTRSDNPRLHAMHLQPVELGDARLDQRYSVRAWSPDAAKTLLSPSVIASLERVASLRLASPVRVAFEPGLLTIEKSAKLTGYASLHSFIRTCLTLLDQAMLTRAEGIDFCEEAIEDDFLPVEEVTCQVCGDLIADDELVSCRRCHTPHHRECWDYYGSCTVYGCQESDYDTPQFAPLIRYVAQQPRIPENNLPDGPPERDAEEDQKAAVTDESDRQELSREPKDARTSRQEPMGRSDEATEQELISPHRDVATDADGVQEDAAPMKERDQP